MGLDRIFYIPIFNTPKVSEPKGNGSKTGRTPGRSDFKPNDLGISYRDGIGCHEHNNCFTCPYHPNKCKFGSNQNNDRLFMANRGNGIKVW